MRVRRILIVAAALPLLGAAAPERVARNAKAAASAAEARAARLEAQADNASDDAARARLREAAVTARIRAAEAAVAAAEAGIALTDRGLADQRARLARQQAPATRLVAAVQSLARRPAAVAVVQPGSTADIVHARALLGTLLPIVRARSEAVRRDLERTRALREEADAAAAALREGRSRLREGQLALARLEGERRLRAGGQNRALYESERAIALGEQARDLAGLMATTAAASEVRASLAGLAGPLPRPSEAAATSAAGFAVPPYRLPVAGRIVEGLGELSDTGVRARGLTIAVAPAARVAAPAAGTIVFARRFREYGTVVIVDHGGGWSTALTGLDGVEVAVGDRVPQGQPVGRAAMSDAARIGVELRRRGTAMDIAQLLG
ncbi:murein hydrolase activator EnvC family protein [Sphingomonas sp.]|uniref:murein hydrolase activator EnvC family protein n=1 Tax=Sphingomonas sp. TaxID=28214 RepID=UPI002DD698B4|nr:peptidoglycan DD-metalloendopeptidase family protein [Sphingomonas sp.]